MSRGRVTLISAIERMHHEPQRYQVIIEMEEGRNNFTSWTYFIEATDELDAFKQVQKAAQKEGLTLLGDEDGDTG